MAQSKPGDYTFLFDDPNFSNFILCLEVHAVLLPEAESWEERFCVHSTLLATHSPYFRKLCLEAKKDLNILNSEEALFTEAQRYLPKPTVTLSIKDSEKATVMQVIMFLYGATLTTNTPIEILDVLKIDYRFEVIGCMTGCAHRLKEIPFTVEFALQYASLSFDILMAQKVTWAPGGGDVRKITNLTLRRRMDC